MMALEQERRLLWLRQHCFGPVVEECVCPGKRFYLRFKKQEEKCKVIRRIYWEGHTLFRQWYGRNPFWYNNPILNYWTPREMYWFKLYSDAFRSAFLENGAILKDNIFPRVLACMNIAFWGRELQGLWKVVITCGTRIDCHVWEGRFTGIALSQPNRVRVWCVPGSFFW